MATWLLENVKADELFSFLLNMCILALFKGQIGVLCGSADILEISF